MRAGRAALAAVMMLLAPAGPAADPAAGPGREDVVDLVSRVEMFVDSWLIREMKGAALKLHEPVRREVVWQAERLWEGTWSSYFSALRDGDLILNYSTSAAGSICVEVLDPAGDPVPGFALADAPALFGDELDAVYRWKDGRRLGELRGGPVMLRFVLTDADLFSIRTGG